LSSSPALATLFLLGVVIARESGAQADHNSVSGLAARLASVTAVTGYEQAMVDTILHLLPGSARDRGGNARLQLGGGSVKRVVVCPLDEPGYVVGAIREDGYLTLRRVPAQVTPLFDQQLEGHRVTIQGRHGPVPGVVAVRSIHLTRGRNAPADSVFSVDDAYVDVGAESQSQAMRLGLGVLAPVTLTKHPQTYGEGLLAAPMAGRRAACAALVLAVRQSRVRAKALPPVTVAFAVEQGMPNLGLGPLAKMLGPLDETLIVDGGPGMPGTLQQDADSEASARWPGLGRVLRWSLATTYSGTPVETVRLADADSLRLALVKWIGGDR
jgi:putative aminopeptidase